MFGRGTGQIWLDNVACESSDSSLDQCLNSYNPWGRHNCDHGKDAGVVCTNCKVKNLRAKLNFNVNLVILYGKVKAICINFP